MLLNFKLGHFFRVTISLGDFLGGNFSGLNRASDFAERIGGAYADGRVHFLDGFGDDGD